MSEITKKRENDTAITDKDNPEKQQNKHADRLKALRMKRNIWVAVSAVLFCLFVFVCMFSVYKRYIDPVIWEAPADVDEKQERIPDQSEDVPACGESSEIPFESGNGASDTDAGDTDENVKNHFTILSVGDVLTAKNGSSEAECDIRNVPDSTHDIIASFYIDKSELEAHGLDTSKMDADKWLIAESGMFEPGYRITSVALNKLPDGGVLPEGTYNIGMTEYFYHHETKKLSNYESDIPMKLEVAK